MLDHRQDDDGGDTGGQGQDPGAQGPPAPHDDPRREALAQSHVETGGRGLGRELPHRLLRRIPSLRPFANTLPFRHGTGPFSMTGDLYDRFSAPVEFRYSRSGTEAFVARAGLALRAIAKERGWMALAERPR